MGLSIGVDAASWAADARTVAVGVDCFNPHTPGHLVRVILAVDTLTGQARIIATGGRDAAFSPTAPRLAYVTGGADSYSPMTLWVADAQGRHARPLITVRGGIASPTWSPDGQSIAYLLGSSVAETTTTAIHTVDTATGRDRTVLADNQRGQSLLPVGGHFTRLAWLAAPSAASGPPSHPSLSFTCDEAIQAGVMCRLVGRGFYPREQVRIIYVVAVGVGDLRKHQAITTTYRRTATTDGQGSFVRPPLHFTLDPHNESFNVRVTVAGARGEQATAGAAGAP